jgi:hypothetical protein
MAVQIAVGNWSIDARVTQLTTVMEDLLSSDFWVVLQGLISPIFSIGALELAGDGNITAVEYSAASYQLSRKFG